MIEVSLLNKLKRESEKKFYFPYIAKNKKCRLKSLHFILSNKSFNP